MTRRTRWWTWGVVVVLAGVAAGAIGLVASPSTVYRLTGSQRYFNRAVSRSVPKGSTLARLEAQVGPGRRGEPPAWLVKMVRREPGRFPDGWREGDTCVSYAFPEKSVWYFQVRDGRLVNYDPSVLAAQPQDQPVTLVRPIR